MDNSVKVTIGILLAVVIILAGILIATLTIPSTGRIITFGCQASITAIDWGMIQPSETKQISFTINNTGSEAGTLSMTTSGMPTALILAWDSEGAILQPAQVRTVTLALTAKANSTAQTFAFNVIITLTQIGGA
jgi:hypothetical protein